MYESVSDLWQRQIFLSRRLEFIYILLGEISCMAAANVKCVFLVLVHESS